MGREPLPATWEAMPCFLLTAKNYSCIWNLYHYPLFRNNPFRAGKFYYFQLWAIWRQISVEKLFTTSKKSLKNVSKSSIYIKLCPLRHASVTFPSISGGTKGKLEKNNMHKKSTWGFKFFLFNNGSESLWTFFLRHLFEISHGWWNTTSNNCLESHWPETSSVADLWLFYYLQP